MPPVAQFSLPNTKQQGQSSPVDTTSKNDTGMPPVATFSLANSKQGQGGGSSENYDNGMGIIKGVGNFLFPIVGDIADDISGKSKKTVLQQVGDTALSALPFIPGLGEAGEALRGGKALVEGAGALSKVSEGTDLASKLYQGIKTANPIVKGAGVGYGAGVASNLSQGKDLGESLTPNTNTILGSFLGGAAPAVTGLISKGVKSLTDISPQIENELTKLGTKGDPKDVALYDQYINAAKTHAGDLRAPSPLTTAADHVDKAAQVVQKKTDLAGQAVGAAKEASANVPLKPLTTVGNSLWKDAQDKYGINLYTGKNGKIIAKKVAGSMIDTSPADVSRITKIAQQLSDLHTSGGTTKNATEVMSNLNNLVDHSKSDIYGHTNDPLEGLIKHTAGNLNDIIRDSSPELAKANDKFSALKDLQNEISNMAGKNLQKGELLMRRVFSGDKSGDVQDFFNKLKSATGIDLVKHAVIAKHAIQSVGSDADKTLLEKMLEEAQGHGGGSATMQALGAGKNIAKKYIANPVKAGRNMIQGKQGVINALGKSAYGIPAKVGAEASRLTSFLNL